MRWGESGLRGIMMTDCVKSEESPGEALCFPTEHQAAQHVLRALSRVEETEGEACFSQTDLTIKTSRSHGQWAALQVNTWVWPSLDKPGLAAESGVFRI